MKMDRLVCINGHFYDGDKYQVCPHCAAGMEPIKPGHFMAEKEMAGQEEKGKNPSGEPKKRFGRRKEKRKRTTDVISAQKEGQAGAMPEAQTARSRMDEGAMKGALRDERGSYESRSRRASGMETEISEDRTQAILLKEREQNPMASGICPNEREGGLGTAAEQTETMKLDSSFLKEMGDGGGKSKPQVLEGHSDKGGERTIGYFSAGMDREPAVGYLICVEGEDYGVGFPLKSGSNSLGRANSMDVVVMDPKVSREKQAFVMYEPHKRDFYLKPGDGAGLCYLNDEVVLESQKLQAYDLIQLGDTKLMLIPVCGEKFSWQ